MSLKSTYIAKLAVRNIKSHRLRSFLTIFGVAIGVGFIIFLLSLGYGLQRISTSQIANLEALQIIDVTPGKSKIVALNNETVDKFTRLSNVTEVEPEVNLVSNLTFGSSTTEGVVYGKNIDYLELEEPQLEKGSIYANNLDKKVILNLTAVKRLGFKDATSAVGKKVNLKMIITKDFLNASSETLLKDDSFEVVGVLKNESSPYAYIPLEVFKTYGVEKYSMAKVKVASKSNVDQTKRQLENLGFKSTTLKDTVDQINQFFMIFQLILFSFGAIAVLIAALGMFNTLTISLLEKTREISFMKVLGVTTGDIWKLFLGEAILIGSIGTVMGLVGGTLLGSALNNTLVDLALKTGNKPVQIFYTPILFVILAFIISIIISVLTGIYPSYRGSKIDPLEAMRYE